MIRGRGFYGAQEVLDLASLLSLLSDPSVLGVGVGEDPNVPGRAVLVVFVQRGGRVAIARELNGVRTRVVETDPIVAYGWNEPAGTSCRAR